MLARIPNRRVSAYVRHRNFTSFEEKEKAEENRFFRQRETRLFDKLRKTLVENKDVNANYEIKLRQIFIKNNAPTDSQLFRDLLNAFTK
jgi:hypothetical protein